MIYIGKTWYWVIIVSYSITWAWLFVLFDASILPVSFSNMKCEILDLNGDNYKMWKKRRLMQLGWVDINYAIRKNEPLAVIPTST